MKGLTLTQPWAQLVADGRKHYETRSWKPNGLQPGDLLAIHAAKGWTAADRDCAEACGYEPSSLPRGVIVAVVRYRGCRRISALDDHKGISEEEVSYGDWRPGRYAWLCDLVAAITNGPECRGALGLWTLPEHIAVSLRVMLA